jgi:alanine racemase
VRESYRCWAEVDLNALQQNLNQIRNWVGPEKKILTVVKADAYGHGLKQIAAVLMQGGTDLFGVANLAEARAIRSVGRGWPILMLGACLPSEVEAAVRDDVMPTISTIQEAEQFSSCAVGQKKTVTAQLKVDTGMGRLGILPGETAPLLDAIDRLPGLAVQGLLTHYSSSEDDAAFSRRQRKTFQALVQSLSARGRRFKWLHMQSTGGLLHEPDDVCNAVRPGLLVYGIIPPGQRATPVALNSRFCPALSWKCRVSLVREVPKGTPVSYGHTFTTRRASRLAIIAAGYADGYFRSASNRAKVLIQGRPCPVVGRVTMDQTVVDTSNLAQVEAGDEVVLLGKQGEQEITANQLAKWCRTIPWEILTSITYRVPRIYKGHSAA